MIQMAERHDDEGFKRRRRHQQRAEGRDEAENRKRSPSFMHPIAAVVDNDKSKKNSNVAVVVGDKW